MSVRPSGPSGPNDRPVLPRRPGRHQRDIEIPDRPLYLTVLNPTGRTTVDWRRDLEPGVQISHSSGAVECEVLGTEPHRLRSSLGVRGSGSLEILLPQWLHHPLQGQDGNPPVLLSVPEIGGALYAIGERAIGLEPADVKGSGYLRAHAVSLGTGLRCSNRSFLHLSAVFAAPGGLSSTRVVLSSEAAAYVDILRASPTVGLSMEADTDERLGVHTYGAWHYKDSSVTTGVGKGGRRFGPHVGQYVVAALESRSGVGRESLVRTLSPAK